AGAIGRWDSVFAIPAIAQRQKLGAGSVISSFGAGGLGGKLLFDDVRMRYSEFESAEELLYRERGQRAAWLQTTNVIVSVLGLVVIGIILAALRKRVGDQATALVERQSQLEEQATALEEQASELEEQ